MNGQEQKMVEENGYGTVDYTSSAAVDTFSTEPMNQQQAMMAGAEGRAFTVGVVNPLNGAVEAPDEFEDEEEEIIQKEKTPEERALEARNKSGLRFILIFGLLVLIFIIMLPVIITLF